MQTLFRMVSIERHWRYFYTKFALHTIYANLAEHTGNRIMNFYALYAILRRDKNWLR